MAPWFLRKAYSSSVLLPRQRRNSTGPENIFRILGSALPTSFVVLGTSPACRKTMLIPASRIRAAVSKICSSSSWKIVFCFVLSRRIGQNSQFTRHKLVTSINPRTTTRRPNTLSLAARAAAKSFSCCSPLTCSQKPNVSLFQKEGSTNGPNFTSSSDRPPRAEARGAVIDSLYIRPLPCSTTKQPQVPILRQRTDRYRYTGSADHQRIRRVNKECVLQHGIAARSSRQKMLRRASGRE